MREHLMQDPRQRAARNAEKQTAVLRFLRDELYTTPRIVAELLGLSPSAAMRTVRTLEAQGFVKRHALPLVPGVPPLRIVGITSAGQSAALDLTTNENVIERCFRSDRVSLTYLQHTLDVQRLRIAAARVGVAKWKNGDRLALVQKGVKKPDAVCIDRAGRRVAVECERSVKGPKSYQDVLAAHLTAMHQGKWARVVWTSPDARTRDHVQRLVRGVRRVRIAGIDTRIEPGKHHAALAFCTHDEFPTQL